jgi:hypothetical protein
LLSPASAEPGMPDQDTFFCWLEENPEASHHLRVKQQVREVLADQEKKKRQAKYGPRRWTELFPLIGPPPLLSTENAQAYADLLAAFAEMLQPEDIMEQIQVKEAVDATWEKARHIREKTDLPERKHQLLVQNHSRFMTDEAHVYTGVGWQFDRHFTVAHAAKEYVRGAVHTNTAEGFFSILKRGVYGVYQHVSEAHLHRYLNEFDLRYSNRIKLGIDDVKRADLAIEGARGKRLTYQTTRSRRAEQTA